GCSSTSWPRRRGWSSTCPTGTPSRARRTCRGAERSSAWPSSARARAASCASTSWSSRTPTSPPRATACGSPCASERPRKAERLLEAGQVRLDQQVEQAHEGERVRGGGVAGHQLAHGALAVEELPHVARLRAEAEGLEGDARVRGGVGVEVGHG